MSSVVGSRTWWAPKSRANCLRAVAISETIILEAPFARRVWSTARPIGPPPRMRTLWPGEKLDMFTACQATARGSINAPISRGTLSGRW